MFATNELRLALIFLKDLRIYYFLIGIIPWKEMHGCFFFTYHNLNLPSPSFPRRVAGIVGVRRARPAAAAIQRVTAVPSASTKTGKSTTTCVARLCRPSSRARPLPPSAPLPLPAAEPAAPRTHHLPPPLLAQPHPARPPPRRTRRARVQADSPASLAPKC